MRKLNTREFVLLGFLGTIAVVMLYINRDTALGGNRANDDGLENLDFDPAPVVRLDRLASLETNYDPDGRNLFQYYTPPPPVRERKIPPPVVRPEPVKSKPPPRPPVKRPDPVPTGPTPPAITFSYLGFLGPQHQKIAVFEDGKELVVARAGDVVKNQFRVIEFGYETVVMGYTDDRFSDKTTELKQKPGASGGRRRGR